MLAGKGFQKVYNLSGGIKAWGKEVARGPEDVGLHLFAEAASGEEAVIIGFGLEMGLRDFYLTMQRRVVREATKSLFGKLADIEIRHPYRDRRLIEFVLTLPAYQIYERGVYKYILRNAMRGILPENIRTRRQPTSISTLFLRGIEREKTVLGSCIQSPQALWRKFVRVDWLLSHTYGLFSTDNKWPNVLVPWSCLANIAWYESFILVNNHFGEINV